MSGKTFQDLLPIKADSKIQLSTAEDVLRALVGVPSKYNLMTPEEQEETFNTFQGLTPNVIWNTISLIDPRIQKVQRPNPSPKGAKEGKTEMTPNDFRRFLAHSVLGLMEKHKDFGDRARMITSVVDMIEKFDMRKSTSEMFPELQSLSDEELNRMLANVPEEDIKKFRKETGEFKGKENLPKETIKQEIPKQESSEKNSLEEFRDKIKKEKKKELNKEYEKALASHVEDKISEMKNDIKNREESLKNTSDPQIRRLKESTLKSKKEKLDFFEEYYPKHGYKGVLSPKEYNEIKKKVKFLYG